MRYTTIKILFALLTWSSFFFLASCDEATTSTDDGELVEQVDTPPPTSIDPNGTSEYYEQGNARSLSADEISGTYTYKNQDSPEGGGYLVLKQLDNGRVKFELDINNGPPNYHSGTAVGEIELNGNSGVYTTSEYKTAGQQPCAISFMLVEGAVELTQEQGSDMSCGFGQGVVADGIYNKKNNKVLFQYEGGR